MKVLRMSSLAETFLTHHFSDCIYDLDTDRLHSCFVYRYIASQTVIRCPVYIKSTIYYFHIQQCNTRVRSRPVITVQLRCHIMSHN